MKIIHRIPELAQNFIDAPRFIADGADVILRYDYERADGTYGQKDLVFRNCRSAVHLRTDEICYTDYQEAYNTVVSDGSTFHVFFDDYGLYSFLAEDFRAGADRFEEIYSAVTAWAKDVQQTHAGRIRFDIVERTGEQLWLILETDQTMSQLLLHRADFAPYRYVSFQVLDLHQPEYAGPAYAFYDTPDSTLPQILTGLEKGLERILSDHD